MTNRLTGKDPDAGKDWRQEERRSVDEMVRKYGHELGRTPGNGEGRGGLACQNPCGRKELDVISWLNKNNRGLRKVDCPSVNERHVICCGPEEYKSMRKREVSPFASCPPAWAGASIFSCPWTRIYTISFCGSLAFRPNLELYHWLSCIYSLQTAYCGTSQPP